MASQSVYINACTSAFNQTLLSAAIKSSLMAQICKTMGIALKGLRSQTPSPGRMFVFGTISGISRSLLGRLVDWGDRKTFNSMTGKPLV